jgi:uroporphyrinogen decarboxylase
MMHSCGAITPLIPLLIEAGVDILNQSVTTAAGMVPADLKARFGERLVFHGGVDTQRGCPSAHLKRLPATPA